MFVLGTCALTDGMQDETIIPNSAISLNPAVGNPGDIRPGNTWDTTGNNNRIVTLNIGDTLQNGGIIGLVDKDNVDKYSVELITPGGLIPLKVRFFHFSVLSFSCIILHFKPIFYEYSFFYVQCLHNFLFFEALSFFPLLRLLPTHPHSTRTQACQVGDSLSIPWLFPSTCPISFPYPLFLLCV